MLNKFIAILALVSLTWACNSTKTTTVTRTETTILDSDDFRSQAPGAAQARPIELGQFQTATLDNGLQLIVVEDDALPRVSYRLFVDVPAHLEGEYAGTAQLAGQMFRRATETKTKAELDEAIDFLGASLSIGSTGGTARGLSRHKDNLMALMAETILKVQFPEEELDIVRAEAKAGLQQTLVTPAGIADRVQSRLWYGEEHPFGEMVTEESYDAIGVEQIQSYYDTYFVPNRSYLVMVGDLTMEEARLLANRYFGNWTPKEVAEPEFNKPERPRGRRISFVHRPGSVQSIIRVGHPVNLSPGDPNTLAARLVGSVLGSPFNGRLFKNLREDKGYTYGAYGSIRANEEVGNMLAYADVRTEVTDSAVTEFLTELEKMTTDLAQEDELARGRSQINGQLAQAMESPETISLYALNTVRYGLSEDHYETLGSRADDISTTELLRTAQQYIKPDELHILVVGDKSIADKLIPFASDGEIHFYDANGQVVEMVEPEAAGDITAEQVLNDYVEALGGQDKLAEVQRLKMVMGGNVQGMTMVQTSYKADNDKFSSITEAMGMVLSDQRYNDGKAKMSVQGQSAPIDETMVSAFREQAIIFPEAKIEDYSEYSVEAGEVIDGEATYAVSREDDGISQTEYYSRETGLKLRSVVVEMGQTQTFDYGDYREVDGIKFPFSFSLSGMAPFPIEMEVSEVEVNGDIDPAVFEVE
ncbi:MAG: pitrilysin family protein [Bacteroidota bacterium]